MVSWWFGKSLLICLLYMARIKGTRMYMGVQQLVMVSYIRSRLVMVSHGQLQSVTVDHGQSRSVTVSHGRSQSVTVSHGQLRWVLGFLIRLTLQRKEVLVAFKPF